MRRPAVNGLLALYVAVVWAAAVIRIDHFPLTWAPMYAVYKPKNEYRVRLMSKKRIRRGFRATHRDGSTSWVGPEELNIPFRNMRRLYAQRAFGKGPPKHEQANAAPDPISRWSRGLEADDDLYIPVQWDRRLFRSLNKTLGHEPLDDEFITRLEASTEVLHFSKPDLRLLKRKKKRAVLEWQDEWRNGWE
ncbi:MAG: hypothetical protein ABR499_13520 [Gemmatimonadaceae bacterium]